MCAALGLAFAAVAAATAVAGPAGLEDPEATVGQGMVARAAAPGPPWWRVEKGGSVAYVLGLPDGPVAKGLEWDQAMLRRRLEGAGVLIVPAQPKAGVGDIPKMVEIMSRLKSKTPMQAGLPEPLRARFAAARQRLGKPASRYDGWDPIAAGQILVNDFHDRAGATAKEPMGAIRKLAGQAHAPVRPASSFSLVALLDSATRGLTPEISRACLAEALEEVEAGSGALDAAGAAWARGDVAGVLAGPRGFSACLLQIQGGAGLWRQGIIQEADALEGALAKPGHAVAALPIRSLVAAGGVLERLKARGYKVSVGGGG